MPTEVFVCSLTFVIVLFLCFLFFYVKYVRENRDKDHACCGKDRIKNPYSNSLMFVLLHSGTSNEDVLDAFYKTKREDSEEFMMKLVQYYRKHNHLTS